MMALHLLLLLGLGCLSHRTAALHCSDFSNCNKDKTDRGTVMEDMMKLKARDHAAALERVSLARASGNNGALFAAQGHRSTACVDGSADGFPCSNADLVGHLTASGLGQSGATCNDVWGWSSSDPVREFAIVGLNSGTAFVEVTGDVLTPRGFLPTSTSSSSWRDVKAIGDYAVIVSEANGHGLQIFDLNQLLSPSANAATVYSASALYTEFGSAHNIVVDEASGFVYSVGSNTCSGGLHVVDLRNPLSPTMAGCFSLDGYCHDAQCVTYDGPDLDYTGREICFAYNTDTVTIIDVTDKSSMSLISRTSYPAFAYTHQGWLDASSNYIVFDDELDERESGFSGPHTHVMDVSNLDSPSYRGFHVGAVPCIDHNQHIRGSLSFQANYNAGLRVLLLGDLSTASMSEVGFFDVDPSTNSVRFNGAWGVYPYLPSNRILITSIESGLFVIDYTGVDPTVASATPTPTVTPSPAAATPSPTTTPSPSPSPDHVRVEMGGTASDGTHITQSVFVRTS